LTINTNKGLAAMNTAQELGLTKLTVKLFEPMYVDFDRQLSNALLRRDAFLDRMIAHEIPYLHEDLQGKSLSNEANRYISHCLKGLGGKKTLPLKTVSISVRHETAESLRSVVREHNLVRDAFLNRLIALLRSSENLLDALGLPSRIRWNRIDNTEDPTISPLRNIADTLNDPLFYLRAACEKQYGCGLYLLEFPVELMGFSCYLDDDRVPGTTSYSERIKETSILFGELDSFESNLTSTKANKEA
jgi:hypothetical protein